MLGTHKPAHPTATSLQFEFELLSRRGWPLTFGGRLYHEGNGQYQRRGASWYSKRFPLVAGLTVTF